MFELIERDHRGSKYRRTSTRIGSAMHDDIWWRYDRAVVDLDRVSRARRFARRNYLITAAVSLLVILGFLAAVEVLTGFDGSTWPFAALAMIAVAIFVGINAYATNESVLTERENEANRHLRLVVERPASGNVACNCCGYSMQDTPVEHDGCSVCPECGSAWRRVIGERPPCA